MTVLSLPYKFLREHGHNVEAYLNGTLNAFASSYIYDNDKNHIYVSVKAENVSNSQYGNHYTNYVLKYPLTDQEYDEYTNFCKEGFLQGLLFIQELDNQKTPEIVNKINVSKTTYDLMVKEYTDSILNVDNYNKMEIDVYKADMESVSISIRESTIANSRKSYIGFVKLDYKLLANPDVYDNDVVYIDSPISVRFDTDGYKKSMENITSFSYGTTINRSSPYPYDYPLYDDRGNRTHTFN